VLSSDNLLSDRGQVAVAEKLGANEIAGRVLIEQEEPTAVLVLKLAELLARDAGRGIHKAHVCTVNLRQPKIQKGKKWHTDTHRGGAWRSEKRRSRGGTRCRRCWHWCYRRRCW
jgi:hypothetical protein